MKKFIFIVSFILLLTITKAQPGDLPSATIDVQGTSKMIIMPDGYKAQFLIQEEEQRAQGYQVIGKLLIDSIKLNLFKNLRKYSIEEKEVKIIATSSRELGQYPNVLINVAYECLLKNKEQGEKLVNELRFPGLKGVVVKAMYTKAAEKMQDSLYDGAVKDAQRIAAALAKKSNKTIGEVRNIEIRDGIITGIRRDGDIYSDMYNSYATAKFEMDYKDKYATCIVRVIYEMK